ncbi:hypothetical protein HG263_00275 [Pseudoalteromonas sp. JBTF-M23]|uniref:Uncharacterized protein n=1 Tax=Pseudoalteromonas caenipelagi TaxID=2726988 RepID=A0A849V829_9GAMM|nr:hypothetical protein [Pseudoalteromonas caenipelagi]NOU48985.1 hypothetical protein [Pseudoalteromonas caenipelagi]
MSEVVEIVDLGFSVADGEDIKFRFDGSDLVLEFSDWREQHISIKCENTLGFKFQNAEYEISDTERFDSCHIVHDSEWVKEHLRQGEAWDDENWYHYKLNFNAAGVVEVLCSRLAKT